MSRHDTHHCDWCGETFEWEGEARQSLPTNWGRVHLNQNIPGNGPTGLFDRDLCPACVEKMIDVMDEG